MRWNIAHLAGSAPQPWKNGGGTTRELARWPLEGDWQWRVSIARIERDGPFSRYTDVQRWFAVLDGAGVLLNRTHRLVPGAPPYCFAGAAATDCQLIDGPTTDFNLMVRAPAVGMVFRVAGGLEFAAAATETIAVFSSGTRCTARFASETAPLLPDELAWVRFDEPQRVRIEADDALCMRIRG